MRIVVTRPLVGAWREVLEGAGEVVLVGGPAGPERRDLLGALNDADALVCLLSDQIDDEVLAAGPGLKIVANYAVGLDNIDCAAAAQRGIAVVNTPNVLTDATADLAWALLLAACRRIPESDQYVRQGRWEGWRPDLMLGQSLAGRRLGILGFGRIGQAVARRGLGFGMSVAYWGRREMDVPGLPAERQDLEALLASADVVSLNLPHTPETAGLLTRDRLELMKPTAILVNTARGKLVDEQALAELLAQGRLFAAGLDVFENEPAVHPALLGLSNVVMAPHIGSATIDTRQRMAELVCQRVVAHLAQG